MVDLARRYAPNVRLIANGGVHDPAQAQEIMAAGADIATLGKAALANPDFPKRIRAAQEMSAFDPALLGPTKGHTEQGATMLNGILCLPRRMWIMNNERRC